MEKLGALNSYATMRVRSPCACLVCVILLATFPAFAHRPYERVAGTFQRRDGTDISIVRHHVDGIVLADPVSIQFRLPDGTEVAHTPHIFDAIMQSVPSGVEVYQFRTIWLPVASRVDIFDGYALNDITSDKHLTSLLVHFAGHWVAYLISIGFAVFLMGLDTALRALPKRGWRATVRSLGLTFVAVAGILFAYHILVFAPVSPVVLVGIGAIFAALFRVVRRKRHAIVG